jgi:periplasmic protein TonB
LDISLKGGCRIAAPYDVIWSGTSVAAGLGEYPDGSHIQRSVRAAAWQFRLRPPRVGGVTKYDEWVRIRSD